MANNVETAKKKSASRIRTYIYCHKVEPYNRKLSLQSFTNVSLCFAFFSSTHCCIEHWICWRAAVRAVGWLGVPQPGRRKGYLTLKCTKLCLKQLNNNFSCAHEWRRWTAILYTSYYLYQYIHVGLFHGAHTLVHNSLVHVSAPLPTTEEQGDLARGPNSLIREYVRLLYSTHHSISAHVYMRNLVSVVALPHLWDKETIPQLLGIQDLVVVVDAFGSGVSEGITIEITYTENR